MIDFIVLGIKPMASGLLDGWAISGLHSQPNFTAIGAATPISRL